MDYRIHSHMVSGPEHLPFDVDSLKAHMVLRFSSDDGLLPGFIGAAVQRFERDTGRLIMRQTWRVISNAWPNRQILLPLAPVAEISVVKYRDSSGVEQTMPESVYRLVQSGSAPRVELNAGESLPSVASAEDSFTIDVVAGYASDASDGELAKIPPDIIVAIKCLASHFYENREAVSPLRLSVVPMAYQCVVDSYRLGYL